MNTEDATELCNYNQSAKFFLLYSFQFLGGFSVDDVCDTFPLSSYLLSYQQCDGRGSVSILIALCICNLFQELHFFLAGHKDDFVITEDHDSIS